MIDEGELDWKVVAISTTDPRCQLVNDVSDMEAHFPGELDAIREWFRTYKTARGQAAEQVRAERGVCWPGLHHGRHPSRRMTSGRHWS